MKFFIPGLIVGMVLNLFLLGPKTAAQIDPLWQGAIPTAGEIETDPGLLQGVQPKAERERERFFVRQEGRYWLLDARGRAVEKGDTGEALVAWSGDGRFYAKYLKVGDAVEFYNTRGERFWKIPSMEYPYISHNANLILLLNGDQSRIRMADQNGALAPDTLAGRTCTVISFPDSGNCGAAGFMDGSFAAIGPGGKILYRGRAPEGMVVKGVAVSPAGSYLAVHCGDVKKDRLLIVETATGDTNEAELPGHHTVKTALQVTDAGYAAIIDREAIIRFKPSGRRSLSLAVPSRRPGTCSLSENRGLYAAAYTMANGEAKLLLFRADGAVLFAREFPTESFMVARLTDRRLFLRGSGNLYCYGLFRPAGE